MGMICQTPEPTAPTVAPMKECIAALLSFVVPFLAGFSFVMNHFYVSGGYLHDSGWFAALMWRPQDFYLTNPAVLDNNLFYSTHLSPILYAIGLLSFFWPWGPITWFASFQGVVLGGSGLMAWIALRRISYFAERPIWHSLLALAFAFNGLAMFILAYPHIEALGTLMVCACLAAFFSGNWRMAALFLMLALSVREDMGFHIVAPLGLLWVWTMWINRRATAGRNILMLLLPAFCLSLAAVLIRSSLFTADGAFTRIYTGVPPYAHLTWSLIQERLAILFSERLYLVLPAAVALLATIVWRNPIPFFGFLAYIPWSLLNFTAFSDAAGRMDVYYPFPFQIAIFWFLWWSAAPHISHLKKTDTLQRLKSINILIPIFMIAGISMTFPWISLLPAWNSNVVRDTDKAADNIEKNRHLFGRMKADPALLSLRPRAFLQEDDLDNPNGDNGPTETLVWHKNSISLAKVRQQLANFEAESLYRIAGTPFYLASHLPRAQLENAGLALQPVMDSNLLPQMKTRYGQVNTSILDLAGTGGKHKLYGPDIVLPPGKYRVDIDARIFDERADEATIEVYNTATGPAISTSLQRGLNGKPATTSLEFTIGQQDLGNWEFRIAGNKLHGIRITGVRLHSTGQDDRS
ncbi:hypothetical protein [Agrobacterium sp. V1]|uniref:hypothetical protein n=1 Tax=Agrobacterium sp. V1 TaxID=3061957 RepID=UPI00267133CE|nr:hypothetical protein [Agrobacterium sp. V1]MDO3444633.1 hypothetical protein [Agrobacterium sp. V1]